MYIQNINSLYTLRTVCAYSMYMHTVYIYCHPCIGGTMCIIIYYVLYSSVLIYYDMQCIICIAMLCIIFMQLSTVLAIKS
jgi:hypothetical protein